MTFLTYLSPYSSFVAERPFLVALLVFVPGIVFGGWLRGFGVPILFWNEDRWTQFVAGLSTGALTVYVFVVDYVIDYKTINLQWRAWSATWLWTRCQPPVIFAFLGVCLCAGVVLLISGVRALVHAKSAAVRPPEGSSAAVATGPAGTETTARSRRRRSWKPRMTVASAPQPGSGPMFTGLAAGVALMEAVTCAMAHFALLRGLKGAALVVVAGAVLVFLLNWKRLPLAKNPATAICILLGVLASVDWVVAAAEQASVGHTILLIVLASFLFLVGLWAYRIRFRALAGPEPARGAIPAIDYDRRFDLLRYDELPEGGLLETRACPWSPDEEGRFERTPRPLVLVCVSGGGLRSAVWTAAVLTKLEEEWPDLASHTRIVAGASGGMVGAGHWVATLNPPGDAQRHAVPPGDLVDQVGEDCLPMVVRTLVVRDIPFAFVWWRRVNADDRGTRLEECWKRNMPSGIARSFGELRGGEEAGWRPSLVFTPMLVEDGRRLFVSNLGLEPLAQNRAMLLGCGDSTTSRSALELARILPRSTASMAIATAARMSASFPYISPAAALPTNPRRRVVDAGYYDNYGVNLACAWLDELYAYDRVWVQGDAAPTPEEVPSQEVPSKKVPLKEVPLKERISRILVIQIRDGAPEAPFKAGVERSTTPLVRGLDGVLSPISAVLAARNAVPVFRNDEQLEILSGKFNRRYPSESAPFFQVVSLQYDGEASLNWYLTDDEQDDLRDRAAAKVGSIRPELKAFAGL